MREGLYRNYLGGVRGGMEWMEEIEVANSYSLERTEQILFIIIFYLL